MPTETEQKHPRVAQDDTDLIRSMETLLRHFDRIAETADRLAKREKADAELVAV